MFVIFLGVFLGIFNMSVVNIVLFMFMKSFNMNLDFVKWILIGFMFVIGIVCLLVGYLGEKFSYKKLYLFVFSGFIIVLVLCVFFLNIVMFVIFCVI